MSNIILCGFMGCGKSTVGKELASKLDLKFIDTDEYIETLTGMQINQIFEQFGEKHFRNIEQNSIEKISKISGYVISTGGGAVLDELNVYNLKQNGTIVFLNVDFQTVLSRLSQSYTRPLIKNSSLGSIKNNFLKRQKIYLSVADIIVDANRSINDICDNIIKNIKQSPIK